MKKILIVLTILLLTTAAYADKDHGYLGVTIQSIANTGEGSEDNGVFIAGVTKGSRRSSSHSRQGSTETTSG